MPAKPRPVADRFWEKVDRAGGPDACWLWTARRITGRRRGYGVLRIAGKHVYAHRISLALAQGEPVSADLVVMHSCDNPPCVNPAHLSVGTNADNAADMARKGRSTAGPRNSHYKHGRRVGVYARSRALAAERNG